MKRLFRFFLFLSVGVFGARGETTVESDPSILDRYFAAMREQQSLLRGVTMDVEIDASVPKLQKEGKLEALRSISKLGQITYHLLRFNGDNSVKKHVIGNYLQAEVESQNGPSLAISTENYKFKFKGNNLRNGRAVYIFQVSPKRKQVGLFKGEIWVDAQTCRPVREAGRFVKNPSLFLKRVDFVRTYEEQNGIAVPQHMESNAATRLFGPVQLEISYSNLAASPEPEPDVVAAGGPGDTR